MFHCVSPIKCTAIELLLMSSLASHPNYKNYEDLLSPGWIPGRKVDNSDAQYSGFRDNLPYLFVLLIVHPLLRRVYNAIFPVNQAADHSPSNTSQGIHAIQSAAADARLNQRLRYDVGFGLIFLCALNGFSAVKVLIILSANFLVATRLPKVYVVPMTWVFNITVLFANELCHGYSYTSIANLTLPFTVWDPNSNWGTFCDEHGGLMPRWEVLFKVTILRLISFNMDLYWSSGREGGASLLEVSFRLVVPNTLG